MAHNVSKRLLGIFAITLIAAAGWAQAQPDQTPRRALRTRHVAPGSYLGIEPRDITPERAQALNLKESRGVEALMVDGDSPAGKVGLKEHDVIVGFNGKQVSSVDQLRRFLRETPPGRTIPLAIKRAGKDLMLKVTLARRPEENAMMPEVPNIPPMPPLDLEIPTIIVLQSSARNGAVVEDLTPQLAEFFGVRNGQGVLVRSVDRGSPAAEAGLKAGDVITKVGNDAVTCSSEFHHIMREHEGSIPLALVRDKREQNVTIKLPEKSPDSSLHFEMPNFNNQMQELQAKLNQILPQSQKQVEMTHSQIEKQMRDYQGEIQKAMKFRDQDWQRVQQQAREAMEKALQELNSK